MLVCFQRVCELGQSLIPSTQRVRFQELTRVLTINLLLLLDCIRGTTCLSTYVTRNLLSWEFCRLLYGHHSNVPTNFKLHPHYWFRRLAAVLLVTRAFPVAGVRVWNSLPVTLTSQSSLLTFRQQLKTLLFD